MSKPVTRERIIQKFRPIESDRIHLIGQANFTVSLFMEAKSRGNESGVDSYEMTAHEERCYNAALDYLARSFFAGASDARLDLVVKDYEVER